MSNQDLIRSALLKNEDRSINVTLVGGEAPNVQESTQLAVKAAVESIDTKVATVTAQNSQTVLLSSIEDKLPPLLTKVPDSKVEAPPMRLVGQDTITVSFVKTGSGLLTPQMTQRTLGTGMAVSQASGALVLTTGTTTNSEFLARSVESFRGANISSFRSFLSQRIINNNFLFMLADSIGEGLSCTINSATSITVALPGHTFDSGDVGQYMFVGGIKSANGIPGRYAIASVVAGTSINLTVAGWPASGSCTLDLFGYNHVKIHYTAAVATNALFDASRNGWSSGDTTLTTLTSASPGHLLQMNNDGRNVYVSDSLTASTTAPNVVCRGSRVEAIPDDNTEMFVYLWAYNGATAPASTTTWTVGMWDIETFPNVPVYIAGQRMQGAAAPQAVQVSGTVSVSSTGVAGTAAIGDVGTQYRANATGAASINQLISAATTNATIVKASAGRVVGWNFLNTNAAIRYVKLHNIATTPTAGSGVVLTIGIPPNNVSQISFPGGIGFATGIGMTTTTGSALADTAAVGAGDIIGEVFYA